MRRRPSSSGVDVDVDDRDSHGLRAPEPGGLRRRLFKSKAVRAEEDIGGLYNVSSSPAGHRAHSVVAVVASPVHALPAAADFPRTRRKSDGVSELSIVGNGFRLSSGFVRYENIGRVR